MATEMTTVQISKETMKLVKQAAVQHDVSYTQMVEFLIRDGLKRVKDLQLTLPDV